MVATQELIKRFPHHCRGRLWRLTARSRNFVDLLASFPAAAVAIACLSPSSTSREAAITLVETGAPLADVARALGIPLWFRRLPPDAFARPPCWPEPYSGLSMPDARVGAAILNSVPSRRSTISLWFDTVTLARATGGDAFAVWIAGLQGVWSAPVAVLPIRILALYAWHSARPDGAAGALIETPWRPELGIGRSAAEATRWLMNVLKRDCGCDVAVVDTSGRSWPMGDIEIVPLTTTAAILTEARAMRNCLPQYIGAVMSGQCRLYGLRGNGRHLATLEIRLAETSSQPYRRQLCRYRNGTPTDELTSTVDHWIASNADALRQEFRLDFGRRSEALFREIVWRPYADHGRDMASMIDPTISDILREMDGLSIFVK